MRKSLLLLSGIGLGAGLAYALQQDRRPYRQALTRVTRYTPSRPRGVERWLDNARGTVQQQARERLPRSWQRHASNTLSTLVPGHRSALVTGLAITGSLALGAGLLYLLDRERVQQAGISTWQHLTTALRQSGRYLGSQMRRMLVESRWQGNAAETPNDDVLIARVRSQIGHVISHASAIGVHAHRGRITLSGPVPGDEIDKLLKTVAGVTGVHKVVSQLEVHEQTDSISGLQENR